MCAFGAHTIKEVTRSQMASASKFFLGAADRQICKGEKSQMMKPLAMAFLNKKIVVVKGDADYNDLSRGDVAKEGTF